MRKATITMLLLLCLSIGGVYVAAAGVHAPHDQVVLTENVVYGDPSAASGLEVQAHVTWDDHLFWDTTLLTGAENRVETDFRFSAEEVRQEEPIEFRGIMPDNSVEFFYDPSQEAVQEYHGIDRAFHELAQTVEPGQEKEATVYLKDYMDNYPVEAVVDLPGLTASLNTQYAPDEAAQLAEIERDILCLQEYFTIPVLEEETYGLLVGKHENGTLSHMFGGPSDSDSFYFREINVIADNACYFTFDTHSNGGQVVDTSRLPNGYGLFRVMFDACHSDSKPVVFEEMDISEPEMVYAIDPNAYIEGLYLSEDQRLLYLLTQENNMLFLTVIDCATMDALQKLEIYDFGEEPGTVHEIRLKDNCWVLWLRGGVLALLEKLPDDLFELAYVTTYDFEEIPEYAMSIYLEADWDGERLAVVDKSYNGRMNVDGHYVVGYDTCGFWLLVYDKHGELAYAGNYESSLSDLIEQPKNSCNPIWPGPPFTVNWKEE